METNFLMITGRRENCSVLPGAGGQGVAFKVGDITTCDYDPIDKGTNHFYAQSKIICRSLL